MRTQLAFGVMLLLAFTVYAQDKKELEKIAGKWQPTMMQLGETKFTAEQIKQTTLIIEVDKYHVNVSGQSDKGTLKLDPKAKPKSMDIVGTEGPNKGKSFPAIYEIEGDSLKICYALEGTKRPTEFKVSGEKVLLVTYQKVKEEKKK